MHEFTPQKGQNMQTCTEKVSIFGVVKSSNVYLQSLRTVTSLYKNMHLHGNPGSLITCLPTSFAQNYRTPVRDLADLQERIYAAVQWRIQNLALGGVRIFLISEVSTK